MTQSNDLGAAAKHRVYKVLRDRARDAHYDDVPILGRAALARAVHYRITLEEAGRLFDVVDALPPEYTISLDAALLVEEARLKPEHARRAVFVWRVPDRTVAW